MTILLYPVRPGEHNPELLMSIRSVARNLLIGDFDVWTVGYKPTWLNPDRHIVGNRKNASPQNVWDNIKIGCAEIVDAGLLAEDVYIMNDDFFVLEPVASIMPTYRGTLADHIALTGPNAANWWARSLRATRDYCEARFDRVLSYDLHRPMPVNPSDMVMALTMAEAELMPTGEELPPQWRSVYGNHFRVQAHQATDVRLRRGHPIPIGSSWVSTSDETWRQFDQQISQFLTSPSRWER